MTDLGRRGLLMGSAAAIWGWPGRDQFRMFDPARADRFQLSLPAVLPDESAFFASHFLEHLPAIPYVHCPSICTTPNGGMLCVWYAGSGEGKKDVQIWGADASVSGSDISWGPPRVLMSRQKAMRDLDRFVRTVGNAIVFPDDRTSLADLCNSSGRRMVWEFTQCMLFARWWSDVATIEASFTESIDEHE